jgi:hypothetical protein
MGKVYRTQIFFDKALKKRKIATGKQWDQLTLIGIETVEERKKKENASEPE